MKNIALVLVLLFAISAFAFTDEGNTSPGFINPAIGVATLDSADWDITVTSLNSFTCSYASSIRGLGYDWETGHLLFNSTEDDKIYTCDPNNGAEMGSIDMWSGAGSHDQAITNASDLTLYCNDWTETSLYRYNSGSWTTNLNPAGNAGRGMDYDGTCLWETYSTNGIYRFQPGGGSELFTLTETTVQLTGLTVFPFGSNIGVMVTCYNDHSFYFYEYDGNDLLYFGSTPVPSGCSKSLGLKYVDARDTFFWSYKNEGIYYVDEMDITFSGTNVEETTWGQIKNQF